MQVNPCNDLEMVVYVLLIFCALDLPGLGMDALEIHILWRFWEDDLIKRLNEWKDFVENRGMRVNMNKTMVMISGEGQKVTQKAVRWPCGVCGRGVGNNSIQCTSCQKWVHRKCSGIKVSM